MSSDGPENPRWAQGLDVGGARRIRNLVAQELRARELTFEFVDEGVEWRTPDGGTSVFTLGPLARTCQATEASLWSDLVQQAIDSWLLMPAPSDHPTLREGELTREALEALRPRAEALLPDPDPKPLRHDPALEASAPLGGVRSPFAKVNQDSDEPLLPPPDLAPDSGPAWPAPFPRESASSPESGPAPGGWVEEEEEEAFETLPGPDNVEAPLSSPMSQGEDDAQRSSPLRRGFGYLVAATLVLTLLLEVRAFFVAPSATKHFTDRGDEALLEAGPVGQVVVYSAVDGRRLGRAPLRILVPEGLSAPLLLSSPGRTPQRVELKAGDALRATLDPRSPNDPTCQVSIVGGSRWKYQTAAGQTADEQGHLQITGTELVRIFPEGYGAWLVSCPESGEKVEANLSHRMTPSLEVRVERPRGARLFLGERPMGNIPVRLSYAGSFAQLRIRSVDGEYLSRWVFTPDDITVAIPISDIGAPPLIMPGSQLEDPTPSYLRRQR